MPEPCVLRSGVWTRCRGHWGALKILNRGVTCLDFAYFKDPPGNNALGRDKEAC